MSTAEALLEAGAVLPLGTTVDKADTVDRLQARTYRHPMQLDRAVVRLVPGTLGAAEDLSMEFLGFDNPLTTVEVGLVRQQALGFPAWALVNDPANGHHALALVKEIERLARMAKSRIGPAKDGFDQLGTRLARSVPHFLPTFYEEAGRAFLAADSGSYAAMMFGKAREAEKVYGLTIDEDRTHAVFLEFGLAGALTAKALSAHARDLISRCEPASAYERFRRLCVERTLGGMPPYAAMPTDLRRLAKAAGLDAGVADRQVLAELLPAAALQRAPEAFWTAYRAPLAGLATEDPAVVGRLLSFLPRNCDGETWLAILDESGATAALVDAKDGLPAATQPGDGAAGWLARFAHHTSGRRRSKRIPALFALIERMAPRLIAEGVPVELCEDWGTSIELLDACLAAGIPIADPSPQMRVALRYFLADDDDADDGAGPGRRDLATTAADPRFLPILVKAVEDYLPEEHDAERVARLVAVPGLRVAAHAWLDELADTVVHQGLPSLPEQLRRVRMIASPDGLAVNPEAARRIAAHDLGPVLGATLRSGVLDEYGWPAFEAAVNELVGGARPTGDDEDIVQSGQWPALVLRRNDVVRVVDADGELLSHHLRIPADERHYMWALALRYVDGQLLVSWDTGPDRSAYWSGTPDDVITKLPDGAFNRHDTSVLLPDGGRTTGGRPLRVGDRSEVQRGRVITDGTTYWVVDSDGEIHEFDPLTGTLGRASMPAFFQAGVVDGEPLRLRSSTLRAAPGVEQSPLGAAGGLVGWRLRRTEDGGYAGEGVDGRAFRLSAAARRDLDGSLVGAIRFPGSDTVYGVLNDQNWRSDDEITLCTADGQAFGHYELGRTRSVFAAGSPLLPHFAFWHYLRPRDPAGSAALRQVTDGLAGELIAAVRALPLAPAAAEPALDEVVEVVRRMLPEISDPALARGVAGVARHAAGQAAGLGILAGVVEGSALLTKPAQDRSTEPVDDGRAPDRVLAAAFGGLLQYCYHRGTSAVRLVEAVGHAMTAPEAPTGPVELPSADRDWLDVLGLVSPAMYRAASPFVAPERRAALLGLLDTMVEVGLLVPGSRIRRLTLTTEQAPPAETTVLTNGSRRFLVLDVDTDDDTSTVEGLEFAPDGVFGPLAGYRITEEELLSDGTADAATVSAFIAEARARGAMPWQPEMAETISRTAGISYAEAVVLLAGFDPAEPDPERLDWAPPELAVSKAAAKVARATWQRLSRVRQAELVNALLPTDPVALWSTGPSLDGLAEWADRRGARRPVSDDLIVEVDRSNVADPIGASELLHGLTTPDTCAWLHRSGSGVDDDDVLVVLARAMPWLAYHLPAGHPLRAQLPVAVELLRRRLADPAFALPIGYVDEDDIGKLAAALGLTVTEGTEGIDLGALRLPPDSGWRQVELRPAKLSGVDDPALAVARAKVDVTDNVLDALTLVLDGRLAALVGAWSTVAETDYPPQDPSRSVPDLVAAVAEKLAISLDAATVYLQLLALPDPTDRNIAAWTGWKPARLKKARQELVDAGDLVAEGKRPRAGRSLFLPCGWLALKAPHLPLETWKTPLATFDADGRPLLGVVVPVAPPARLFELAWARVRDGDVPRFDELVTERQRRR